MHKATFVLKWRILRFTRRRPCNHYLIRTLGWLKGNWNTKFWNSTNKGSANETLSWDPVKEGLCDHLNSFDFDDSGLLSLGRKKKLQGSTV